jgi:YegS/Rv2252/BmrU family lipid kinase
VSSPAAVVVVNPRAAGGAAALRWSQYADGLRKAIGAFDVATTAARGDATRLVREAVAAGARCIVVVGGDGTLNEAVNGLWREHGARGAAIDPDLRFGFVPCGTGTDFARSVGFAGPGAALEALRTGRERRVDLGRVDYAGGKRLFVNVAGCGLAGDVVRRVDRMQAARLLGARALFLVATLRALAAYRPQPLRLTIDGRGERIDDVATIAVANGGWFGGGMRVAPDARLDDGRFDVVVIRGAGNKLALLPKLPRLYNGSHCALPIVRIERASRVTIEPLATDASPPWLDLDGESPGAAPASFEVLPAALRLLA